MTPEELEETLRKYNIPFYTWGQFGGKNFEELLTELNTGESWLVESDGRIYRRVECAALDVFYHHESGRKLYLKETLHLVGGKERKRKRKWSIYEKKRLEETPLACARRALQEELGITAKLPLHGSQLKYEECESTSFRGLWCSYAFHPFEVYLPEEWYRPEGYVDTSEVPHEITHFAWK
jgi:hypothetical protein